MSLLPDMYMFFRLKGNRFYSVCSIWPERWIYKDEVYGIDMFME
jgi:hypothetical protein